MKFSKNYIITICSSVLFFSTSNGKEQEMRQPDDFSELDRKILMNTPGEMVNDIRFLLQNPKTTVWARETLLQNLSFLKRGDYLKKNLDLLKKYNFDSAQHTGILLAKISESYHSFLLTPTSVYACQSTYRHDQGRWELSLQRHEGNFSSMWESAARTLKNILIIKVLQMDHGWMRLCSMSVLLTETKGGHLSFILVFMIHPIPYPQNRQRHGLICTILSKKIFLP